MTTETKAGEPARGARKRPRVGVLTRFVSVFVFVLIFGFSNFYFYMCTYQYSIAQYVCAPRTCAE